MERSPPIPPVELPQEPIGRLVAPLERFIHVEASSGIVLLVAAAVAVVLANSPLQEAFLGVWKIPFTIGLGSFQMSYSLEHWINDGLMALFFFVIGLEVKREIVLGELQSLRQAALPIAAALGGMVVPAGIYLTLQAGEPGEAGWGIAMATDIAFVVGCMAVLGNRIPHGLRVLLLSAAIADDVGAILVIAIGYTETIYLGPLAIGIAGIAAIAGLQRLGGRSFGAYAVLGTGVWFFFHESGIHATIAGVILGLLAPSNPYLGGSTFGQMVRNADEFLHGDWRSDPHLLERVQRFRWATREMISPLDFLVHRLHPWVSFVIMPVFALANAGVPLQLGYFSDPIAMSVAAGLVIGKPVGVVLFSFMAVRLGIAVLPEGVDWIALTGGGLLAGIGFTMALFIADLALEGGSPLYAAKVGILFASLVAALGGVAILVWHLPPGESQ